MQVEITIKNYRCFPDSKPAKILLQEGFISFVGVNNSGKSTLLKFFYEFRKIFQLLSDGGRIIDVLDGKFHGFNLPSPISDVEEIFCNANNRDLEIQIRYISITKEKQQNNELIPVRFDIIIKRDTNQLTSKIYLSRGELIFNHNKPNHSMRLQETTLLFEDNPKAELSGIIQTFKTLSETLYIGPFRNVINAVPGENYYDIQVGKQFIDTWRRWKTGKEKRQNESTIRLTDDIKHIFDYDVLEINPSEKGDDLKVFINGKSYKLSELGSGITQFILVLANAIIKHPSYILIDEPELNLHPSLQLDFLTTLGSYATEGVLFATHSIGLARASADRIYSVRKIVDGESEISDFEATSCFSEFLGELSFTGYKELGFDKVLLVEGTTDVKTIQQFLHLHKIDHKIVLLPMGGRSLINNSSEQELAEITRISDNIFALIDSERNESGAELAPGRAAFVEICEKIGIDCHLLDRRATENYFPDRAVKKIKGDEYRALEHYEKLGEISHPWSKNENWKIAREMTLDDLNGTDLGEFLLTLK